jgi:hypothetical protein
MSGKQLNPEELRKLTNVIDLLDDGVENGSDISSAPIKQLPHRSVSATPDAGSAVKRASYSARILSLILSKLLIYATLVIVAFVGLVYSIVRWA